MVREETILLVEDDPDDELMTRRTLKKNNICNDLVVARDGAEARARGWCDTPCSPRPGSRRSFSSRRWPIRS